MYKKAQPFFMIVETPLHAGSGTDLGVVDLPIQREKHTDFPKIEGSSLKGSIREVFENLRTKDNKVDSPKLKAAFPSIEDAEEEKEPNGKIKYDTALNLSFGPEKGDEHAGALGFTDARLLLFPVKSMKGIFAWITCPAILERFKKDIKLCKINDMPDVPDENSVPMNCGLIIKDDNIVLEEYTFKMSSHHEKCTEFANWAKNKIIPDDLEYKYWQEKISKDIVVLNNDDFRDFVTLSTEVITRIKIDDKTGTVQPGALFTEEYLPSETILYSLALTSPVFIEKEKDKGIFAGKYGENLVMDYFIKGLPSVIQIGGNANLGKGLVRTNIMEKNNA